MPKTVVQMFKLLKCHKNQKVWNVVPLSIAWTIWRNQMVELLMELKGQIQMIKESLL